MEYKEYLGKQMEIKLHYFITIEICTVPYLDEEGISTYKWFKED